MASPTAVETSLRIGLALCLALTAQKKKKPAARARMTLDVQSVQAPRAKLSKVRKKKGVWQCMVFQNDTQD